MLEGTDGTDTTKRLDFLDAPASRPLHGQLIPPHSYPVEPPDEGRIEDWDVRAPNCAVDDRRQRAS